MSRLQSSVGEGGRNSKVDVKYVQFLLCDWQYFKCGKGLVVDGIVGPITKAAIKDFQNKHSSIVDGRVDPAGPAIQVLEKMHINNVGLAITESASKYKYHPTIPVPGPLSWSTILERYFNALYDNFKS